MNYKKKYLIELATTLSGHWYSVSDDKGKLIGYFPSPTTILTAYPQSQQLVQWIAEQGWHESQRIKSEAGERGTRIHAACDALEDGLTLNIESYSTEEWVKIDAFVRWFKEYNPKLIAKELAVFSRRFGYAGRIDRVYGINGEIHVLDLKSSRNLHNNFPLQVASYAQALEENTDIKVDLTSILQLGTSSKAGYKFVQYEDWRTQFKVFKSVQETWYFERGKKKEPPVLDLPKTLSL